MTNQRKQMTISVSYDQIKSKSDKPWKVGDIAITMEDDQFEIVDVVGGVATLRELAPDKRQPYTYTQAIVTVNKQSPN